MIDLGAAVAEVAELWRMDQAGWTPVDEGPAPVVHLPAARAVLQVSRAEVGEARVTALATARSRLSAAGIPVVGRRAARDGATWHRVQDRVVEVEDHVAHDGRMNTWGRLETGCAVLARVHDAWAELDLGAEGEHCDWANWLPAAETLPRCRAAGHRLRDLGLPALAEDVERLAELTAAGPADATLPRQVVHGDFWDDNVYLRGERIVAVTDLDFLGRRPRVDDLALLLYFADEQPFFDGSGPRDAATRAAELAVLVRAYAGALVSPLRPEEQVALPWALARQPLWTYGRWLLVDPDDEHARAEARATAPAVGRALEVAADTARWQEAFAG